jgi:hypothetical protein
MIPVPFGDKSTKEQKAVADCSSARAQEIKAG